MNDREVMKLALEVLENNKRTHYYCEDTWYSCPKHEEGCADDSQGNECNCGADKVNVQIELAATALRTALAATEREKVAAWMRSKSYATGHGDTVEDLLKEMEWQVAEREREARAKADTQGSCIACGNRITHPVPQQVKATAQKGGDKLSPTSKAMRTCKYCNGAYTANAFTTRTGFTCKWCADVIRERNEQEQPR